MFQDFKRRVSEFLVEIIRVRIDKKRNLGIALPARSGNPLVSGNLGKETSTRKLRNFTPLGNAQRFFQKPANRPVGQQFVGNRRQRGHQFE